MPKYTIPYIFLINMPTISHLHLDGTGLLQDLALFRCLQGPRRPSRHPHLHPPPGQTQTHLSPLRRLWRLRSGKECREVGAEREEDGGEGVGETYWVSGGIADNFGEEIDGVKPFWCKMRNYKNWYIT